MSKICTNIEQSKKLVELGIDVNSADMHWQYVEEDNGQLQWFYFPKDFSINQKESIPAWSLTALMELMPEHFALDYIENKWMAYNTKFGTKSINANNPLDAVFEMVCWLKENEKI